MRIIESASADPAMNLALEEELFSRYDGAEDILFLWINSPCIIIGANQRPEQEADLERAERLGIPVLRRGTGGGAVYQDEGNLNFTYITRNQKER